MILHVKSLFEPSFEGNGHTSKWTLPHSETPSTEATNGSTPEPTSPSVHAKRGPQARARAVTPGHPHPAPTECGHLPSVRARPLPRRANKSRAGGPNRRHHRLTEDGGRPAQASAVSSGHPRPGPNRRSPAIDRAPSPRIARSRRQFGPPSPRPELAGSQRPITPLLPNSPTALPQHRQPCARGCLCPGEAVCAPAAVRARPMSPTHGDVGCSRWIPAREIPTVE